MIKLTCVFVLALVACSSPAPQVTVDVITPVTDAATPPLADAAVTPGVDVALISDDAGSPDAGEDVTQPSLDAGTDAAIEPDAQAPHDAGPAPDAYDGITCANSAWTWGGTTVTGCDGKVFLPSGWYLETASTTCPADGTGWGTCAKGATCEVVMVVSGQTTTYAVGTCQ